MTTHDEQTLSPPDQSQNAATPTADEETAAPGASATSAEPAASPQEVSAEQPNVEHESATEQTLFGDEELAELRGRWAGVQAAFVDDPKDCVQKADALVSDLVDQLTRGFANARSRLEEQWARGEQASTEDLRVALMNYREFFERLLAV